MPRYGFRFGPLHDDQGADAPAPPVHGPSLLLEDGASFLLLEDGSRLLLE